MKFRDLPDNQILELMEAGILDPDTGFGPEDTIPNEFIRDFGIRGQKAAESTRQAEYDALFTDEGGIFKYSTEFPTGPEGETKTYTWGRNKPLSPQDFEFMEQVRKRDFPEREPLDIKKTLADDPQKVFQYVMNEGLVDIPEGMSYEEVMDRFGYTPTQFREIAMGKEPSIIGAMGDELSNPGRQFMSRAVDPLFKGTYDPREAGRMTSDFQGGALNPARIAGDVMRSEITPLSILGSGLVPSALTLKGNLIREAGLGAAEGVAEVGMSSLKGLADPSASNYFTGAGLGAGLGAAVPGAIQGGRQGLEKLKQARLTKEGPTLKQRYYDAKQSIADSDILGFGMNPFRVKAEGMVKGKPSTPYAKGAVKDYAELLGMDPNDLYPGLGIEFRSNQNLLDLRNLATRNPDLHRQWMGTYDRLLKGMDQITDYSNAMSLDQAGDLMRTSVQDARDILFRTHDTTYKNVLNDPELGPKVDANFGEKEASDALWKINDLVDKYEKRVPQGLKPTGEVDLEGNPIYTIGDSRISQQQYSRLQNAIVELKQAKDIILGRMIVPGGQETRPGYGTVLSQLNKARATIQENLKATSPLERTPIQTEFSSDIRNLFRENILGAVEKTDKDVYDKLLKTNEAVTKFTKDVGKLKADLDSEVRSDKQVASAILDNNKKMDALSDIMGNYGKVADPENTTMFSGRSEDFDKIRDAWFKHKVMKQSAATGDISNKIAKPLQESEKFIKKFYAKTPYDKLEKYAKGLLTMGDPQLIGMAGALNEASKGGFKLPKSASEARKLMQDALSPDAKVQADISSLANIYRDQADAIIADYGKRRLRPATRLDELVRRVDLSLPRATYGVSENEQRQPYSPKRSNFWKDQARRK